MDSVLTILGGGAVFAFIEFLIRRYDDKKGILSAIQKEIQMMKEERAEDKATSARRRILNASDTIRHYDTKHSKEWFDQINQDIDEYEKYCETHEAYKNNRAVMAIDNLKQVYKRCLEQNDFL